MHCVSDIIMTDAIARSDISNLGFTSYMLHLVGLISPIIKLYLDLENVIAIESLSLYRIEVYRFR